MIEDVTSSYASTAEVRAEVDKLLADAERLNPTKKLDRDSWLRGSDAREGQNQMLQLAKGAS